MTKEKTLFKDIKQETNKEKTEVTFTGSASWETLTPYYERTLASLAKNTEIDGFRKGHAPEAAVENKYGEMAVLQEAAQRFLSDAYIEVVQKDSLKVVGYPSMNITKMAKGSALEFTIVTAVMPEIKLGDYVKVAKTAFGKKLEVKVEEKDLTEATERILNMQAHTHTPCEHDHEEGEECTHEKPKAELTDEFVKTLGFETVADFQEKLKEQITLQKTTDAKAAQREEAIVGILKETPFDVPETMVQNELERMVGGQKDEIERMGLVFDKWLEHIKKTEAELRDDMKEQARERTKADILMKKIAEKEEIKADEEKVKTYVAQIVQSNPDLPEANIAMYAENMYLNEAVLEWLEAQGGEKKQ